MVELSPQERKDQCEDRGGSSKQRMAQVRKPRGGQQWWEKTFPAHARSWDVQGA